MNFYEYKGKPYKVLAQSKIKIYDEAGMNGEWVDVIIYETLYDNKDGSIWVRFKEDFEVNFKKLEQ